MASRQDPPLFLRKCMTLWDLKVFRICTYVSADSKRVADLSFDWRRVRARTFTGFYLSGMVPQLYRSVKSDCEIQVCESIGGLSFDRVAPPMVGLHSVVVV